MNCFNTVASDAYVRADGQVQPSANVWELRDYYKRMWKLKQECAKETPYPLMVSLHVTNGQIIPVTAWGDVNLDIEWEWASGRKSFPPDVVLAETAGRQSGSYGFVHYCLVPFREWREMWAAQQKLGAAKANAEPGFVALQRTNWAMQFVHETAREPVKMPAAVPLEKMVRDFGYGRPDCRIVNYWTGDDRAPGDPVVACSNPKVKWLGMWKPAERVLLLALVNWDDDGQKAVLTLKNARGGSLGARRDAETGAPVPDGELEFKGREVKFIRVAAGEPGP